jgi:hypothetical protein
MFRLSPVHHPNPTPTIHPELAEGEDTMAEAPESNPVGRPSKYDPCYCRRVIEFMGQGYSLTAFAGSVDVARSTINVWMAEHPEFSEAVKVGQAKRTASLEMGLLDAEVGPRVTARIFALKNAAPEEWKDKVEQQISGGLKVSRIELVGVEPDDDRAG